jgi:tetratricopeptide (TPR) repeat protein
MKKLLNVLVFSLLVAKAMAQGIEVSNAIAYRDQGQLDKAKTAIDKASQHEKTKIKAKTWYTRGSVYQAIAYDQTGIYSKLDSNAILTAYEAYQKAAEVEPESKDAKKALEDVKKIMVSVSYRYFQLKNNEKAMEIAEKGLAASPKDSTLALIGAYASQNSQKYDKATTFYEQYLANGGKDKNTYLTLVQLFKQQKNYDKALQYAKQGMTESPDNEDIARETLDIYLSTGKTEEALVSTQELIKKNPNNPLFHQLLGQLYNQQKQEDKALESYDNALKIEPNNYDINFNAGVIHFNRGAAITQKIQEKPVKIGQADPREKEMKDHFQKALPYFERANNVKPDEIEILKPLASIYRTLGMKDKEKVVLKKIENMN